MGLAERRTVPHDRRVKLVALTRRGLKMRSELLEEFYKPPEEILPLSNSQMERLGEILEKTVANPESATAQRQPQPD